MNPVGCPSSNAMGPPAMQMANPPQHAERKTADGFLGQVSMKTPAQMARMLTAV